MKLQSKISLYENPRAMPKQQAYPASLKATLDLKDVPQAIADISAWPNYSQSPLLTLDTIAKQMGVETIWYKDESRRFGLGSFKALGGAYAVAIQIIDYLKANRKLDLSVKDLLSGEYASQISDVCVSCATDGNHGRSVAWGAQLFGCKAVIYIHQHVSSGRERMMQQYGAQVVRIDGNYDDSVRQAAQDAKQYDRIIVSDTSYPGYMEIPKIVALGYTVMFDEIDKQLGGQRPTHVFVQGGVGGLASAACAYFWQKWGEQRPTFIIVEPEKANCLQESAKANKPTVVTGDLETLMAGLSCGEVSLLAWDILSIGTDYFTTVNEQAIAPSMRLLAEHDIEAGESAVAGLAALEAAVGKMGIDKSSKVLLLGTEGATDPDIYEQLTGIKVA